MKKPKILLWSGICGVAILIATLLWITFLPAKHQKQQETLELLARPVPTATTYQKTLQIEGGKTFSVVMTDAGIGATTAQKIFHASENVYDLSLIKVGKDLQLTFDRTTDQLRGLKYEINDEEELLVSIDTSSTTPAWIAKRVTIPYEIKLKTVSGTINDSLYVDGLKLDIPEGTLIEFADIFEYALDYAYDVRHGDTFQFVYEERYLHGEYIMPGRILAGKFVNADHPYFAYYFVESEENKGYFDEDGNALQKMFLRAPVAFKYISSGFTTGARYVSAFNVSTGHRAIDYAAAYGTPIRAVGDGTVTFAGWSKAGYGNLTSIRHNSTYSTNYAHQSKFAVKRGQHVTQGQVIGYVGSTGFSTGPHLHFEMVKNGVKINPLREVLPPGKPIKEENKARFEEKKSELDLFFTKNE